MIAIIYSRAGTDISDWQAGSFSHLLLLDEYHIQEYSIIHGYGPSKAMLLWDKRTRALQCLLGLPWDYLQCGGIPDFSLYLLRLKNYFRLCLTGDRILKRKPACREIEEPNRNNCRSSGFAAWSRHQSRAQLTRNGTSYFYSIFI